MGNCTKPTQLRYSNLSSKISSTYVLELHIMLSHFTK